MQCIVDGKSVIMEGMHLDPGLYLYEFARYSQAHLSERLSRRRSLKMTDWRAASAPQEESAAAQELPSQAAAAAATESSPGEDLRWDTSSWIFSYALIELSHRPATQDRRAMRGIHDAVRR